MRFGLSGLYRIRYRLLLVNLLVVAVPLLGIVVARFYEREMLQGLENDMIHQGQLLREILMADEAGLRLETRAPALRAAARETRTRIRLLDATGAVLADSHREGPPEGPERPPPHFLPQIDFLDYDARRSAPSPRAASAPAPLDVSSRPEVKRALAGQYGAATRIWRNGDLVYLFSAVPIARRGGSHDGGHDGGTVEGVVYVTRTTVPVRLALRRLRTTFLQVLGISVVSTAVITIFLAGTISGPLTRLTARARRIARGDRSVSLNLERRDEIGELARAFDAMARKLDERARYVADLAANISHEFKSPLTGIRGATELLLEGAGEDPATRRRFLENVLADAHRLDRLVTRLLEFSRVEVDAAPDEVLDYEALVREVARLHAPASGTAVEVEYRASATQIRGRRAHLASALGNLVDNALQHAEPGSAVRVHVGDGPSRTLRTRVHNRGVPISDANLPRIFDRFFTTRGEHGGTGLGLPIVRMVVVAHGGTLDVTSTPAEGTTFQFDLPRV